jgi:hypothetical protein
MTTSQECRIGKLRLPCFFLHGQDELNPEVRFRVENMMGFPRIFLLSAALCALPCLAAAQETTPDADLPATRVDDIVVRGGRLDDLVSDFVIEAAAHSRGRGLARWRDGVCVGVVNVQTAVAQYVADRVSEVALSLGVPPGEPGCRADVVIVFTDDGRGFASALREEYRRAFTVGTPGLDRGRSAFDDFVESDRPVRWWHTSMPVNAETGMRAVRLPGDVDDRGNPAAPIIRTFAASRLTTQIRDDLLEGVGLPQLADYLAFVALAQVDLNGSFEGYDSILTIFDGSGGPQGLTDWDVSYLSSLYQILDAPQFRTDPSSTASSVAGAMTRDRRDAE